MVSVNAGVSVAFSSSLNTSATCARSPEGATSHHSFSVSVSCVPVVASETLGYFFGSRNTFSSRSHRITL